MPGDRVLEIGPGLGFLTGGLLAAGASGDGRRARPRDGRVPARYVRRRGRGRAPAADRGRRARPGPRRAGRAAVRRRRQPPVPDHEPRPAPAARPRAARRSAGPDAPARGRRAGRGRARARCRTCRCSCSTTPRPGSRSGCRARRSSRRPRSSRPCWCSSRIPPTTGWTRRRRTTLWRVVQAGFRERRKMLHNVLTRQLPIEPDRVDAALDGRRDRPRSAARRRSRWGSGSRSPRRSARSRRPDDAGCPRMTRRSRRRPPPRARSIRLAPAKVNLTLAVLGTRPDGFHDLHSVMVPLDLADRLSVSVLPPGTAGQPPRRWVRPGTARRQPRAARDRRRPSPRRGGHWAVADALATARGPAGQADPGRRRPRRRLVRRRGDGRRGARGMGRGRRARAEARRADRRRARVGRAVLPRRRAGARRGPRGAGDAARLAARCRQRRRRRPVPIVRACWS